MPRRRRLPLDPEKSAAIAGLLYISEQTSGLTRVRRGRGFAYLDSQGHSVRDKTELHRIRSLVIPPAWTKVWICPDPAGHLQAFGYDARGRKQYRYHAVYRMLRNQTKFDRMTQVAAAVARVRERIREHFALPGMPREKVLAAAVRLLDSTGIRIGNEESAAENKTFGLTTLRNRHVEIEGATLRFRFTGKSGVKQEVEITDRRLAHVVRQCQDLPGQQLFEYVDENGSPQGVSSTDVNAYLRDLSGETLTAKDFRTWTGTVECAVALRDIGEFSSETEAKRNIVAAIKTTAARLGNRVATCRAYYVHPAVPEAYLEGDLLAAMRRTGESADTSGDSTLTPEEKAVLTIIRRHAHGLEETVAAASAQ